ncbi:MAG TPA: hypothetical protein VGB74_08445 [Actinoplanes sp.]
MTGPGDGGARRRGRPWLIALITAWALVLVAVSVWSVGHERASVPEQRDIAQALPALQKAAGVLFAAAGGPGRAVILGELTLSKDCRVTPVRSGIAAVRDVTVHVRAGEARATLEAIAAELPESYQADVAAFRGGSELSLHADAGNFIGIDAEVKAAASTLTVQVTTGCRPLGSGELNRADPPAGPAPAVLSELLGVLGAQPVAFRSGAAAGAAGAGGTQAVRVVACPAGGVAGTFVVDGVPTPGDLRQRLRRFSSGEGAVRDEESVHAYRAGADSVVVVPDGPRLRVSASTSC